MLESARQSTSSLARVLIAPSPHLPDVADRARARLLATLLAVLIPLGACSALTQLATVPGFASTFAAIAVALAILVVAYALARSRHYRVGAVLASGVPIAACGLVGLATPEDPGWFAFMIVGVLFATMFLSRGGATLIALLALGTVTAVAVLNPQFRVANRLLPALGLHSVLSGLLLVAMRHRDGLERERAEAARRQEATLAASRHFETLGHLAGTIAHDFNNVLTVVVGNSELIVTRSSDARSRDLASEIQVAALRASDLTRQLLDFARKHPAKTECLDLNEVTQALLPLLRRLAREAVELEFVPAKALPAVRADRSQVEQILVNLVVNARDAMPRGGRLTIETGSDDLPAREGPRPPAAGPGAHLDARSHVVLTVTDTGIGMDAATLDRIFEPFFTTKGSGGTGLGLTTVKSIVERAGGLVEVRSAPGAGTSFRLYLPRIEGLAGRGDRAPATDEPARVTRARILLLEDDDSTRRVASRVLTDAGHTVHEASDSAEAVAVYGATGGAVDLLIADVMIPGGTGVEVARRLRRERADLPVLYISGYTDGIALQDGGFLAKPFTSDALRRGVDRALASRV